MTANFREFRHFLQQRLDSHSQWEIRKLAHEILIKLHEQAPCVFEDIFLAISSI
jgi:thymidylate synthase ThyX